MIRRAALAATLLMASSSALAADALRSGFANPPQSARPRVWWHWLGGNITKDGIGKDLDWLKSVGIGGVQNFDADLGTPQVVAKRLAYMKPEWRDAFRFAATRAEANGLELAIASSPGWSETGGPWVAPADAMKKLSWSETIVHGGQRVIGTLAPAPGITGPFQTVKFFDPSPGPPRSEASLPAFHQDVAVLAMPIVSTADAVPAQVSDDAGPVVASALFDDDFESVVNVPKGNAERPGTVLLDYGRTTTIRSARLFVPHAKSMFSEAAFTPRLDAEVGGQWRQIATIPLNAVPTTVSFPAVTASRFRIILTPNTVKPLGLGEGAPGAENFDFFGGGKPSATIAIGDLRLSGEARIDRAETKAGFDLVPDYYAFAPINDGGVGPAPAQVIDLTSRMHADGRLDWTAPAGSDWRILRLGTSLLGTTNHPATPEATGLEVDKYDAAAVRRYLETYLGHYRDAAGSDLIGQHGVRALLNDSIEVGPSNWTLSMLDHFRQLRGYDARPWLPTLTGALIGTRADSDRFLYDWRRTLSDLMASQHYATIATVAREHGLTTYGEALEDVRPVLGDDLQMRKYVDVPMAALWSFSAGSQPRSTLLGDMKGAASAANLYGRKFVAAESMTAVSSPWAFAPADLKHVIDVEFVQGVNRPVIHTSVHSPMDDKEPGLSLAIFGQYFNRHETWSGMAKPWVDYMARTSFLLQQGRTVADVAYFYGEEMPITALYAKAEPTDLPTRYGFDFVNSDVLANLLSVEGHDLVAPSGARYRLLYLGGTSARMTLPTLQRIAALAEAGATIVGKRPSYSPSQADDPVRFAALAQRLWSGAPITVVGRGLVVDRSDAEAGLTAAGVAPDVEFAGISTAGSIKFLHRKLADGELYFLNNRRAQAQRVEASFRVAGKAPQLWHADTGAIESLSYRIVGGRTIVPLDLGQEDSALVVFREPAGRTDRRVASPFLRTIQAIDGPWGVSFQPGRGAPASAELPTLRSLSENADPKIRYFSGTAIYSTVFKWRTGSSRAPLWLDLGKIGDVAEVRVNGRLAGTVWHTPNRLDISRLARPGVNRLEVKVADLWVNRLIGDAQSGAAKIAFVAAPTYRPDAPLRPSGLIGPVTLLVESGAK